MRADNETDRQTYTDTFIAIPRTTSLSEPRAWDEQAKGQQRRLVPPLLLLWCRGHNSNLFVSDIIIPAKMM